MHNLNVKIPKELMSEFNTEIVNKFGNIYGNTIGCLKEAMALWVEKAKKERTEKQKLIKEIKEVEEINVNM